MALNYKKLKEKSYEEIVEMYNKVAKNTSDSLSFYAAELERRNNDKKDKIMITCTKWITVMTIIMTIGTIINIVIAFD